MKAKKNKVSINVRITEEEKDTIEDYCSQKGMTQTEVIRRFIQSLSVSN